MGSGSAPPTAENGATTPFRLILDDCRLVWSGFRKLGVVCGDSNNGQPIRSEETRFHALCLSELHHHAALPISNRGSDAMAAMSVA